MILDMKMIKKPAISEAIIYKNGKLFYQCNCYLHTRVL
jgi:hypothetical protein